MSRLKLIAAAALVALALAVASAGADSESVRDRKRDTRALERKPELDIVRATAGHTADGRLEHRVTMRGRLKSKRKNTRPFVLINSRGGKRSDFEYVVLGPRVLEVRGERFVKVGSSQLSTRRRTWIYRFDPESFGAPSSYGWAVLASKGKAVDLAPNGRYKIHDLRR